VVEQPETTSMMTILDLHRTTDKTIRESWISNNEIGTIGRLGRDWDRDIVLNEV